MSWTTTFARFRPGSLPFFGPVVVRVEDWSKPRPGEAPLFDRPPLFERFSVAGPALPILLYVPAGVWLCWSAASEGLSPVRVLLWYASGLFVWTLFEYVMHRGSFHLEPSSTRQVAYAYLVHGVHHAYPDDSRRWMMPLIVTLPVATLFLFGFSALLGAPGLAMFAGFLHGYLTYDLLHFLIHRGPMPTRVGRFLRQYHLTHHYKNPERHYGVSSPFWDVVFRTK